MEVGIEGRYAGRVRSVLAAAGPFSSWGEVAEALWREAERIDARIGPERAFADRLGAAAIFLEKISPEGLYSYIPSPNIRHAESIPKENDMTTRFTTGLLSDDHHRFVRRGYHVCREYPDGSVRRQCQYPTTRQAQAHVDQGNGRLNEADGIAGAYRPPWHSSHD